MAFIGFIESVFEKRVPQYSFWNVMWFCRACSGFSFHLAVTNHTERDTHTHTREKNSKKMKPFLFEKISMPVKIYLLTGCKLLGLCDLSYFYCSQHFSAHFFRSFIYEEETFVQCVWFFCSFRAFLFSLDGIWQHIFAWLPFQTEFHLWIVTTWICRR